MLWSSYIYGTTHSGYIQACTDTLTVYCFHVFVYKIDMYLPIVIGDVEGPARRRAQFNR